MRIFDIKLYEDSPKDSNGNYVYDLNDSTTVELGTVLNYYLEKEKIKGTTKEMQYGYFESGKLGSSGALIAGVAVGISKKYNMGEVVSQKDEDAPYIFTMEDLRILLLKMFDRDILKPDHKVRILRYENDAFGDPRFTSVKYLYELFVQTEAVHPVGEYLFIDAYS